MAVGMNQTFTLEMVGGTRVVTPGSVNLITPYVLSEQRDWFEDEISFLRRALLPGQQAIDIGANYGVYTLSIASVVGPTGAVWAFEPASSTAAFLEQSIAVNKFTQVVLERSALARECGTAQLTTNDNSELNALVRDAQSGGASETVRLVTLDDCLQRYGWKQIDFLKIDAEGGEADIIEGGRRFFAKLSPLILYEVKAGEEVHLELVEKFAAVGFDSYRMVPGPDLLVPFDAASKPDGYLLNLFCCKKDRADQLCDRGLLLDSSSIASYKAGNRFNDFLREHRYQYRWENELARLPYAALCAPLWRSAGDDSVDVCDALTCFAISQDVDFNPLERFSALERSFLTLMRVWQRAPQYFRLASLARVARDYGARSIAVGALGQLAEKLAKNERLDPGEPFLAPGKRFDTIAPRADMKSWILASVLEELERLDSFSSFFTGERSRERLELITVLGYESEEMRRRLQLVRARFPRSA
jgi:FkbM family methyltransferase